MEIQATEEENAAFLFFITLIRKMLSDDKLGLNFYMPITLVCIFNYYGLFKKVDQNFLQSEKRNAIIKEKFWFRKNYFNSIYLFGILKNFKGNPNE